MILLVGMKIFGIYHGLKSYGESIEPEGSNDRNGDLLDVGLEGHRERGWWNASLPCAWSHFEAIRWATSSACSTSALEGDE